MISHAQNSTKFQVERQAIQRGAIARKACCVDQRNVWRRQTALATMPTSHFFVTIFIKDFL